MVIEAETGFHFRRRDDCLRIAMTDAVPRWGFEQIVDETVFGDRLERLAHRYPSAARPRIARAWAGLYDMTPDAHPIIGPVATASMQRADSPATDSCSRLQSAARLPKSSFTASPRSIWRRTA